ncbi:hypothetical protein Pfo_002616 [Paulownia fortunei]|nr:hypothetical protein Pfo_002616 [Paulownia fortunei]
MSPPDHGSDDEGKSPPKGDKEGHDGKGSQPPENDHGSGDDQGKSTPPSEGDKEGHGGKGSPPPENDHGSGDGKSPPPSKGDGDGKGHEKATPPKSSPPKEKSPPPPPLSTATSTTVFSYSTISAAIFSSPCTYDTIITSYSNTNSTTLFPSSTVSAAIFSAPYSYDTIITTSSNTNSTPISTTFSTYPYTISSSINSNFTTPSSPQYSPPPPTTPSQTPPTSPPQYSPPPTPTTPTPSPPLPTPTTPTPSPPLPTPSSPSPPPSPSSPTPSPPASSPPISPTPPPTSLTPPPSPVPVSPSPPTSLPTPPSDSSEAAGGRRKRCKNTNYPQCYGLEQVCPSSCPNTCEVDCVTCKPVFKCDMPGAVCQDPRFIGGDGITFYFHGKKDQDFCLVTEPNLHVNAHFIGRRNENMKRDFTWVQSIGILFGDHQLFVGAQKTATWNDAIDRLSLTFDGEPIVLPVAEGSTWQTAALPSATMKRDSDTNSVIIEVDGLFKISAKVVPITQQESNVHNYGITEDDCFAHLELGFKFFSLSGTVNGVLGQTYRNNYVSRVKMGVPMPVLGGEREFTVSSLFATNCAVSQFRGGKLRPRNDEVSALGLELSSMKCGSGIDGRGVVCKR